MINPLLNNLHNLHDLCDTGNGLRLSGMIYVRMYFAFYLPTYTVHANPSFHTLRHILYLICTWRISHPASLKALKAALDFLPFYIITTPSPLPCFPHILFIAQTWDLLFFLYSAMSTYFSPTRHSKMNLGLKRKDHLKKTFKLKREWMKNKKKRHQWC